VFDSILYLSLACFILIILILQITFAKCQTSPLTKLESVNTTLDKLETCQLLLTSITARVPSLILLLLKPELSPVKQLETPDLQIHVKMNKNVESPLNLPVSPFTTKQTLPAQVARN
jgi:hypothetical protein